MCYHDCIVKGHLNKKYKENIYHRKRIGFRIILYYISRAL